MRAVVVAAGGPAVERSGGGSGLFPDGAADAIKEDIDREDRLQSVTERATLIRTSSNGHNNLS